jgi:6-phosphogluconolactonase/glucosamine-6-phosphate isomerase/deaminase
MLLRVFPDKSSLSQAAAEHAANAIRTALTKRSHARIVAATAASQIEFLDALTKAPGIDWSKVEAFHLDEYIGLPITHPGSFRKMLLEQLIQKTGISKYHLLDGDASAKTATLHLTTRPRTLKWKIHTLLSNSMRHAACNRWAKPGLRTSRKCLGARFLCPSAKS